MMNDIRAWLESIGLEEYAEAFETNRIDADVLPHLTEQDLADLGLPVGPRRKLLVAIRTQAEKPSAEPPHPAAPDVLPRSAKRRHITVMFCDLVGSTALSEALDAEELRNVMQAYQQAAGAVIERYAGHVAQYLGDGLMTYFGWPTAHEDDAERLQFEQALDDCRSVIDLAARIGQARAEIVSRSTSCWVLLEQGEFALAEEHARRGVDVADRIGARRLIPAFSDALAQIRLHAGDRAGDRAGAVELLESGWAISRETGVTHAGPTVLGLLALATTDPVRRHEALREGQAILERGCVSHNYFWFYRRAIEVSLAEADWDAADAYGRALERYFHAEPVPWSDFVVARGRALAELGRLGSRERVVVQLRRLRDDAMRLGLKTELERLDAALESARAAELERRHLLGLRFSLDTCSERACPDARFQNIGRTAHFPTCWRASCAETHVCLI